MTYANEPAFEEQLSLSDWKRFRRLSALVQAVKENFGKGQKATTEFCAIVREHPRLANARQIVDLAKIVVLDPEGWESRWTKDLLVWLAEKGPDEVNRRFTGELVTIAQTEKTNTNLALDILGLIVRKWPGAGEAAADLMPGLEKIAATTKEPRHSKKAKDIISEMKKNLPEPVYAAPDKRGLSGRIKRHLTSFRHPAA